MEYYKNYDHHVHSVFSATLLLSITALFREPKAYEDHPTLMTITSCSWLGCCLAFIGV
jgi:hypothetical protein